MISTSFCHTRTPRLASHTLYTSVRSPTTPPTLPVALSGRRMDIICANCACIHEMEEEKVVGRKEGEGKGKVGRGKGGCGDGWRIFRGRESRSGLWFRRGSDTTNR
ncbi:hypothetical protein E2C01_069270 [Portunus trituberculatus]|uniref:Uncharacterized protein n=1 Tax=Portunus trituberculatus TaxID=210409 RepID=A0A5B7HR02_PORTR|nr:hypothetical protein [Portunus trituberculatus]